MLTDRGRYLLPLLLACAFLTGCGGSAEPGAALPAIGATAVPVITPSSPNSRPAHARPLGERAAAVHAVRRYYTVLNGLRHHMAVAPMARLFTPDCPCQAQVDAIRTAIAANEHFVDQVSVNVMRPSVQDARHAFVLVNLDTARAGLSRADGARVTSSPPHHGVQRVFRLVRVDDRWLIDRIEAG